MKKRFVLFVLLFSFLLSSAQETWIKYIEFDSASAPGAVLYTDDGGVLIMAALYENNKTIIQRHLVKLDKNGNLDWDREFPNTETWIRGLKYHDRGEERFVFVYQKRRNRRHFILGMQILNAKGEVLRKTFFTDEESMSIDRLFFFNNEIWMKISLGSNPDDKEKIFIYTSLTGNEKGYESFTKAQKFQVAQWERIKFISPKEYYVPVQNGENKTVHHIKKGKKSVWSADYCFKDEDCRIIDVKEFGDYRYLVTSLIKQGYRITKLDKDNKVLWTQRVYQTFYYLGTTILENGDLIMGVGRPNPRPKDRGRILKISADGEKLWEKSYLVGKKDYPRKFRQTADGGYYLIGFAIDPRDSKKKILIIKTDSDGNTKNLDGNYERVFVNEG